MLRFLFKVFKILLFLIASIYLPGLFFETIIKKNTVDKQFQLQEDWHVKHKDTIEALFIGNSRIYQMVDIPYLEMHTGYNFYSLCQASRSSQVLYYKLLEYLKRNNPPKYVYLQFDPFFCGMDLTQGTFNGKQSYLAYIFNDCLKINHLFRNESGFNPLEEYVPILRYFHSGAKGPYILIAHLFNLHPYKSEFFKNGIEIEDKKWDKSSNWTAPTKPIINMKFNFIDSFCLTCSSNNIKLILIYPPQSYPSYSQIDSNVIIGLSNYSKAKKVEFWNFNNNKYNNQSMFYNHMHLNAVGTKVFRVDLVTKIKNMN